MSSKDQDQIPLEDLLTTAGREGRSRADKSAASTEERSTMEEALQDDATRARLERLREGDADAGAGWTPPAGERLPMKGQDDRGAGAATRSTLEKLKSPTDAGRRMGAGGHDDDDASATETFTPETSAAARMLLSPTEGSPEGVSPVSGAGNPTDATAARFSLGEEESLAKGGTSPVEAAGITTSDATARFALGEVEEEAISGVSSLESAGQPSDNADNAFPIWPVTSVDKDVRSMESVGSPAQDARRRIGLGEAPRRAADRAGSLEGIGQPSEDPADRRAFEPVRAGPGQPTGETYGHPSDNADNRMGFGRTVGRGDAGSSLGGAGRTTSDVGKRMGRIEPEELEGASPLESAGNPTEDVAARFGFVDPFEPLPASGLSGADELSSDASDRVKRSEPRQGGRAKGTDGLAGLGAVPVLPGGINRFRREEVSQPPPVHRPGIDPVSPMVVRMMGELSSEQQTALGDDPRHIGDRTEERLDFIHYRFERVQVERPAYLPWNDPLGTPTVAELPRFAAGDVPLGNGMLAQLLASRYHDDLGLDQQQNLLARIHKPMSRGRLRTATSRGCALIQPVLNQMWNDLCAAKQVQVSQTGHGAMHVQPHRQDPGRVKAAGDPRHVVFWYEGPGSESPMGQLRGKAVDGLTDPDEVFGRIMETNVNGHWAHVRRRFTLALVSSPEDARRVLFACHNLERARAVAPREMPQILAKIKKQLEDSRDANPEPKGAFDFAVLYALALWPRLEQAELPAGGNRPWRAEAVPWYLDEADAPPAEALTWYSLVQSCVRLGIRPWTYLHELFDAVSTPAGITAKDWTPAAWAKRQSS